MGRPRNGPDWTDVGQSFRAIQSHYDVIVTLMVEALPDVRGSGLSVALMAVSCGPGTDLRNMVTIVSEPFPREADASLAAVVYRLGYELERELTHKAAMTDMFNEA